MKDVPETSSRVRFILVDTSHPGNIGAAARAIHTMGFTDLVCVHPKDPDFRTHPEAVAFATSSIDVLQAARSFDTLEEALSDVTLAFAMTGYSREFGPPLEDLSVAAVRADKLLRSDARTRIAFVFGCERSGLTNAQIDCCQRCAAIVANPHSPSLNLAQAVQVAGYEMQLSLLGQGHAHELYEWQERFDEEPPAGSQALERFFTHWEEAMTACGALDPEEPKNLMGMSRRLFARAALTQHEVDLLRGICAAIIRPKSERIGSKKPRRVE